MQVEALDVEALDMHKLLTGVQYSAGKMVTNLLCNVYGCLHA